MADGTFNVLEVADWLRGLGQNRASKKYFKENPQALSSSTNMQQIPADLFNNPYAQRAIAQAIDAMGPGMEQQRLTQGSQLHREQTEAQLLEALPQILQDLQFSGGMLPDEASSIAQKAYGSFGTGPAGKVGGAISQGMSDVYNRAAAMAAGALDQPGDANVPPLLARPSDSPPVQGPSPESRSMLGDFVKRLFGPMDPTFSSRPQQSILPKDATKASPLSPFRPGAGRRPGDEPRSGPFGAMGSPAFSVPYGITLDDLLRLIGVEGEKKEKGK